MTTYTRRLARVVHAVDSAEVVLAARRRRGALTGGGRGDATVAVDGTRHGLHPLYVTCPGVTEVFKLVSVSKLALSTLR